jgi:starch-binding outer membrane protein, SusD/RagB family
MKIDINHLGQSRWILATGIAGLLMVQTSCKKDFLDVPPQAQQQATQFWRNQADVTQAVNAAYANLREWKQTAFAAIAVESMGSDEAEKGSSVGDATFMNDYDNFTVSSSQGQLSDFWNGQYQEINFCNQVLDHIDTIAVDATLKTRYIAEMKFLRAYSYFRLVRAFGDVVLRLHLPKDASEYNLPRTPKVQVYAAIEQDLNDAAAVLPQSYGAADVGRATKGAALALHAKVAMYQTLGNTAKWQDVLNYTNQVIALGYSLFPNYEAQFRIPNENNVESIFEIQAQRVPSISDASNSQYSQVQGVRGVTWGGWGFNVPTASLATAYEANDPRRDATIIFRGETTPQGDVVPATGDNPMYNQKSYVPSSYFVSGFTEGSDQNVRILRFADVLLMNAEAANETGNTTLALQSLERVRARARTGAPTGTLPPITTTDKAALRNAIWQERRVELAMEFDRYFDVIRQGRGTAVFGPKGWRAGKNEVWPVPQNEIDISAGLLTQNPGY